MKNEIKGNIPDYPDYFITSCGRVWSFKSNKFLKLKKDRYEYCYVDLYNENGQKRFYIHQLVALAYLSNPENLPEINHKDECKEHNYVGNLEWCDRKYNCNYGTRNERIKKKIQKKVMCVETGKIFDSIKEAARFVNRAATSICACARGRQETCGGFHWKYYNEE